MVKREIYRKLRLLGSTGRIKHDFIRLLFFSGLIGHSNILIIVKDTQDIIVQCNPVTLFRNLFSTVCQETIIRKCQCLRITQIIHLWNQCSHVIISTDLIVHLILSRIAKIVKRHKACRLIIFDTKIRNCHQLPVIRKREIHRVSRIVYTGFGSYQFLSLLVIDMDPGYLSICQNHTCDSLRVDAHFLYREFCLYISNSSTEIVNPNIRSFLIINYAILTTHGYYRILHGLRFIPHFFSLSIQKCHTVTAVF